MKLIDYLKAAGIGLTVMVLTVAASFPMVFIYAQFIAPGHSQPFYNEAATWIAPWSSHVLGPLLFFIFNFWLARRRPERHAIAFAALTVALYALIDFGMMLAFVPPSTLLTMPVALSLAGKLAAALGGAWCARRSVANRR